MGMTKTGTETDILTATHRLMAAKMAATPGMTLSESAVWVLDMMATERPSLLRKVFAGLMAEMA